METTNRSSKKHFVLERANQSSRKLEKLPYRLSDLPDSVLCHILSFLPTKLSVSTSILARRWKFLWADVPNLDFDVVNYDDNTFSAIINRVMMMRNMGPINTFRLSSSKKDLCPIEFDTWIRTAVARNVQALDLILNYQPLLPPCIFTCKSLIDLRLRGCEGIPLQGRDVCLPSLKKLHLHSVKFEVDNNLAHQLFGSPKKLHLHSVKFEFDNNLAHLLSGCPVLEELIIHNHDFECNISSITINRLVLNFSKSHTCDYELEINSPALRYLVVEDNFLECISAGIFNSLVEADICLDDHLVVDDDMDDGVVDYYNDDEAEDYDNDDEVVDYNNDDEVEDYVPYSRPVLYSHSVLEFVDRLCHVKSLSLSSPYVQFEDSSFATATTRFHNLTKLELEADWRFLLKFLECADNLQVLIINRADKYLRCWTEPQGIPTCISTHLKQVTFVFDYSEDEFELVGYILKNAKVLKLMELQCEYIDPDSKFVAVQRILRFERGSETCKIEFS